MMVKEEDIQIFIDSLRKLSKSFNMRFQEEFEDLIKEEFAPIKVYIHYSPLFGH
jgi:hypothetical protein